MNIKQLLLIVCCCVGAFALDSLADMKSLSLESVKTGQSYGPFIIKEGVPVVLGEGVYRINPSEGGKVSFLSERGSVNGPYEVRLGRIVTIGSDLYTIVDINVHAAPSAGPAATPSRKSDSAPATAVEQSQPSPTRGTQSGAGRSRRPVPSREPVRQTVQAPIEFPNRQGHSFMDGAGLSLDVGVFEQVGYGRTLTGGLGVSDTAIKRDSASLALRTGRLTLRGGMVFSAEADTMISGDSLPFVDADLQNGEGWWATAEVRNGLWSADEWRLDFNVLGSYRRETYDLTYGVWQSSGTVVVAGTNGSPDTVVQLQSLVQARAGAVFTESLLELGFVLSRATPTWSAYLGFGVIVLEDAALDTPISTPALSYEIEFERTDPFSVTAGLSIRQWGIHWFTDLSVIGEDSLRVGAALVF